MVLDVSSYEAVHEDRACEREDLEIAENAISGVLRSWLDSHVGVYLGTLPEAYELPRPSRSALSCRKGADPVGRTSF